MTNKIYTTTINITEKQKEWLDKRYINLSKFIRDVIDLKMQETELKEFDMNKDDVAQFI